MPDAEQRQVAKGSAWTALSWGVGALTGPLLAVFLVRAMTHRQYGALSVATDAVGLIAAALSFGLGPAVTQVAVRERVRTGQTGERAVLSRALRLSMRGTAISIPVIAVIAVVFEVDPHLRPGLIPLLAMAPIAILAPASGVLLGAFRAFQWPRGLAGALIAGSLATAGAVVALILIGHPDAFRVGFAFDVRPIVGLPLLALPIAHWWRSRRSDDRGDNAPLAPRISRRLVSFAVGFALALTFGSIVAQLDVVVLGAFRGARATGLYSPASAVASFALGIPFVVASFYLPVVTRLIAEGDQRSVKSLYHWATRLSVVFASPVLAVVVVCPAALLTFVFGHSISVEAAPLRVMGAAAAVSTLCGFNNVTLDAQGFVRFTAYRLLALIALSTIACLVLVPFFGAMGAAGATAVGVVAENAVCSRALSSRFGLLPWDWRLGLVAVAFVASLGISYPIQAAIPSAFGRCAVTAVLVAVITGAVAFMVEDKEERRSIVRGIRRRANPFGAARRVVSANQAAI